MSRKDKREERDVKRTDRVVEEALRRHGPGVDALVEAVKNQGKGKR